MNILRDHGIDPWPKRGAGSWDDFLKRYLTTLWACDFFSVKSYTLAGAIDLYVLFFVHVGSRKVHIAGVTANPDAAWVAQQARNLTMFFDTQEDKPTHLLRDRDTKFTRQFDAILESEGIEVKPVCVRAPNMNAAAERFVQSVKTECLEHFLILGEKHLRYLLREYELFYNEERPHQGKDNKPLSLWQEPQPLEVIRFEDIACDERLGGLLRSYRRAA